MFVCMMAPILGLLERLEMYERRCTDDHRKDYRDDEEAEPNR